MTAYLQAVGLVLLAGLVFVAIPIAGTVVGPLLGIVFLIVMLAAIIRELKH